MSCTSSLHSLMYYICCIGEADTSQNIYATSKYVLLQNDGRTTTNSAGMCENSTEVHDKFMKINFQPQDQVHECLSEHLTVGWWPTHC